MIPNRLIRTVPEVTDDETEARWERAQVLHPDWDCVTYRDPIDPALFPLTSALWKHCTSGAQLAGLVRLEALWLHGGIYIDSDVELFRPLDDLLEVPGEAFAVREDEGWIIPDAVLGARHNHQAIMDCIAIASKRLQGKSKREWNDWRDDSGAWATGPGATTTVFSQRADVTILRSVSFYPVSHAPRETLQERLDAFVFRPGTDNYGLHLYRGSWL